MGRLRSLGCCPENTAIDKGAEWNEKNTSGLDASPANAEGHKDLLLLLSGHVMVVSQLLLAYLPVMPAMLVFHPVVPPLAFDIKVHMLAVRLM